MKKKVNYWFQIVALLIGISAVAIIVFAMLVTTSSAPASPSTAPAPTSPANGYPGPTVQPSITPTLEPDYSATLVALKTSHPLPTSARPVGICECVDTAMLKMGYDLQNSWQRQINGHWVVVEVGSLQSDPDQGIVILAWEGAPGAGGRFKTPVKAGPVRIVAEKNNRLTLQTAGKQGAAAGTTTFYFDVPGRRFASSLTEIIPTAVISFSATLSAPTVLSTPTPAQAYP